MNKGEFTECFADWLDYKTARKKDWPETLAPVYFKALGQYRPVELTEALGRLIEQQADFPTIAKIKEALSAGAQKRIAERGPDLELGEHSNTAQRLLEVAFGLPTKQPEEVPSWLPELVEVAVKGAIEQTNKLIRENYISEAAYTKTAIGYAAGAVNVLIARR